MRNRGVRHAALRTIRARKIPGEYARGCTIFIQLLNQRAAYVPLPKAAAQIQVANIIQFGDICSRIVT